MDVDGAGPVCLPKLWGGLYPAVPRLVTADYDDDDDDVIFFKYVNVIETVNF